MMDFMNLEVIDGATIKGVDIDRAYSWLSVPDN